MAVSGGPDSTALLCLLTELRDLGAATASGGEPCGSHLPRGDSEAPIGRDAPRAGAAAGVAASPAILAFPEILVGHVHHGLRGRDADQDEEFVRNLAHAKGCPFVVHRGDAREEARGRGLSPEAGARALRFRAFRLWADEQRLGAIFLGHHRDDQAETVLLRAIRGAGIAGLGAMQPVRRLSSRTGKRTLIVRPLLSWSRQSILRYLDGRGQPYRTDATNLDLSVPRNRIRSEVLPLLDGQVQAGASLSLARLGGIASEVARDLRALGARAVAEACVPGPRDSLCLSVERLRCWPPSVLREALCLALDKLAARRAREGASGEPAVEAERAHLPRRVFRIVAGWLAGSGLPVARVDFGGSADAEHHSLELRYGVLRLRRVLGSGATRGDPTEAPVGSPIAWGDWMLEIGEEPAPAPPVVPDPQGPPPEPARSSWEEVVDAEAVGRAGSLRVRSRREGDRLQPLGCAGRKSLKAFLRERRVWPSDRDSVPLLVAGDAIVWVVGQRIDHRFRVHAATRRVLRLRAWRAEPQQES